MVLILEIAFGIVLGVLILNNLSSILTIGVILLIAAAAVVVIGFLIYWISGSVAALIALVCVVIVGWLYYISRDKVAAHRKISELKDKINRRTANGYDVAELQEELNALLSVRQKDGDKSTVNRGNKLSFKARVFSSASTKEKLNRKALGYDD